MVKIPQMTMRWRYFKFEVCQTGYQHSFLMGWKDIPIIPYMPVFVSDFLIDEQPKPCQGLPALHTYHTVVSGMSRAFEQWESSRMSSVLQYTDCELRQVQFALVHCINAFNLLDSNLFNCVLNNYYQSVNIRVNFNCQSTFFSISWTGQ